MYPFFRRVLFTLNPEQAHALTLNLIRLAGLIPPLGNLVRGLFTTPARPRTVFGINFANPVGLAAGYDKDALGWRGLACLGFGHIEIGTVTPRPQPGNPQPRLFRLPEQRAIINRMGFPGRGSQFVARQLKGQRPKGVVLGVNIGKNKDTPLEEAVNDYVSLFHTFAPLADYLAVNVSSPNTVGLRRLQARAALESLLASLAAERQARQADLGKNVPILVKLAPDLSEAELDDALGAVQTAGMEGVIATNTTLSRAGVPARWEQEAGGLSGPPLYPRSLAAVRYIAAQTGGQLPIIGVGGIDSPASAQAMLEAGAALVQVYTGLIYAGPALVKKIVQQV